MAAYILNAEHSLGFASDSSSPSSISSLMSVSEKVLSHFMVSRNQLSDTNILSPPTAEDHSSVGSPIMCAPEDRYSPTTPLDDDWYFEEPSDTVIMRYQYVQPPPRPSLPPYDFDDKYDNAAVNIQEVAPYAPRRVSIQEVMMHRPLTPVSPLATCEPELDTEFDTDTEFDPDVDILYLIYGRECNADDFICEYYRPCAAGNKNGRKVISHIFGRNKFCTLQIPGWCFPWFCRKHYQRAAYRNPSWPLIECILLLRALQRMKLWGQVAYFIVCARKRSRKTNESNNSTQTSSPRQRPKNRQLKKQQPKKERPKKKTAPPAPIPEWLSGMIDKRISFEEAEDIVTRIMTEIIASEKSENKLRFPDIELLPTFKDTHVPRGRVSKKGAVSKPRKAPKAAEGPLSKGQGRGHDAAPVIYITLVCMWTITCRLPACLPTSLSIVFIPDTCNIFFCTFVLTLEDAFSLCLSLCLSSLVFFRCSRWAAIHTPICMYTMTLAYPHLQTRRLTHTDTFPDWPLSIHHLLTPRFLSSPTSSIAYRQ